ncbi:MAG TPA: hypothetical protein VNZ06_11090 [Steroidobacteraceae bacterium]|nr:hypothetical protein [Steroidobacteraceae bacterium]
MKLSRLSRVSRSPLTAPVKWWTAFVCLVIVARAVWILSGGPRRIVFFVPDDAFYYFITATNFADTGEWTFDHGLSHTTGVQWLHAYALAGLSWLMKPKPGLRLVYLAIVLSTACAVAGAVVTVRFVRRTCGEVAAASLALPLLSMGFLKGASSGMEWGWVVLISSIIFAIFSRLGSAPLPRRQALGLLALGLLLELARSDAGALAAATLAGTGLVACWRPNRPAMHGAGMLLAGATLGLLLTLGHTYALSGHLLSGSVRIKMLWGTRSSFSLRPFGDLLLSAIGIPQRGRSTPVLAVLAVLILAAAAAPALRKPIPWLQALTLQQANLCALSLCSLLIYSLLFGLNPSVLSWYTSLIALPVCVLVAACSQGAWRAGRPAMQMVAAVFWCALVGYAVIDGFIERGHMQLLYYKAALRLGQELPGATVGCWSCGILSFFSAGPGRPPLINLDGLMNDDVYPYIEANDLASYVVGNRIHYVLDESAYIEERRARVLGGYDSEQFLKMLTVIERFPYSETATDSTVPSLYRLDY